MSFESNKAEVIELFENHILKYIVKDLKVLDGIKADESGAGGCAIPQATAAFSALDLMGYLTNPQEVRPVEMRIKDFLGNPLYFPTIQHLVTQSGFLDFIRDNVRSIMAHRFALSIFDITKEDNGHLFYQEGNKYIFSARHLTHLTISAINHVYQSIQTDSFRINGFTNEESIEKMKTKVDKLKSYIGTDFTGLSGLFVSTTTTQTTSSLG